MANHEIAVQLTVMPAPVEVNRLLFKAVAYSRQAIGLETCQLGREPGERNDFPLPGSWRQTAATGHVIRVPWQPPRVRKLSTLAELPSFTGLNVQHHPCHCHQGKARPRPGRQAPPSGPVRKAGSLAWGTFSSRDLIIAGSLGAIQIMETAHARVSRKSSRTVESCMAQS